jgi:hypothetical protein
MPHDVVHCALEELRGELSNSQWQEVVDKLRQHPKEIKDRRARQSCEPRGRNPKGIAQGEPAPSIRPLKRDVNVTSLLKFGHIYQTFPTQFRFHPCGHLLK